MPKIVILDGYTTNPGDLSWAQMEALGELTVYDRSRPEEVASRIGDADIVFTNKTPVTRETMDACPNIRFIGVLATGYNIVDVGCAKEKGIPVCNASSYGTTAVAQLVFAHLLEVCHHVAHHSERVHRGEWAVRKDFSFWDYPLIELAGKTMGIVGFGKIGQQTARIALAFGMKVLYCDTAPRKDWEGQAEAATLESLLARSDVVSLHCPLFPDTQGMINKKTIAGMKDGAILINTSRGPLVVEQDVVDALTSGKLYYYCGDVVSVEPIEDANPLLSARNCFLTPHIAWAPLESRIRMYDITIANLKAFLAGNPQNVVNP